MSRISHARYAALLQASKYYTLQLSKYYTFQYLSNTQQTKGGIMYGMGY